ncbi:LuxR C-terminal-related transcriptional regulator, partial [Paenibacillus sepulcri]|nr:LuxR C-terminal-related transcriptional regulator [Paenibacillus sepulcri]
QLIKNGSANKSIARELSLTEGTIKVYLSRIYGKLGVSSRTQALVIAEELQLLEPLDADHKAPGS